MFKSHLIRSNYKVLRQNRVNTFGARVLYCFWWQNCELTPMSILCTLDFYDRGKYGSSFLAGSFNLPSRWMTHYTGLIQTKPCCFRIPLLCVLARD